MKPLRFGACLVPILCLWSAAPAAYPPVPRNQDALVQWSVKNDFINNEPHNPIVVKDLVIVGTDNGDLRAFHCADGKPAWTCPEANRLYHRPCSDGERVFCSSAAGVSAVSVTGGRKLWQFATANCDGPLLSPPGKGVVYVGGDDGSLYALDAKEGTQKWASDFMKDAPADPPKFDGAQARFANKNARPSGLAFMGDMVFLTIFDQCRVIAVEAATGKRVWSYQTAGWIGGMPVATEKHVFVGSQDQFFRCLDIKTGKLVWKYEAKGRTDVGGSVDDKSVYFGSSDGFVHCLDQATGKLLWDFKVDPKPDGRTSTVYSIPSVGPKAICFAAAEGQLYSLDKEKGTLKWKIRPDPGADIYCSPVTDGSLFFVTSRGGGTRENSRAGLFAIGLR